MNSSQEIWFTNYTKDELSFSLSERLDDFPCVMIVSNDGKRYDGYTLELFDMLKLRSWLNDAINEVTYRVNSGKTCTETNAERK